MTSSASSNPGNTGTVPQWTVGDRLRKAREMVGLDMQEFASDLGVSRTTVHTYEHSDKVPRRLLLQAWALRTGVNPEWLATGELPFDDADPDSEVSKSQNTEPTFPCLSGYLSGGSVILGPWSASPAASTRRTFLTVA